MRILLTSLVLFFSTVLGAAENAVSVPQTPPRISLDYGGKPFGGFVEPLRLKDVWTLAVQAKATGPDGSFVFTHGSAHGRRGTAVFGLARTAGDRIAFIDGGAHGDDHRTIAEKFVPNIDRQLHLYVITKRADGYATLLVDGAFAGGVTGFWAEPNEGFLAFGGIYWRGAGMGLQKNDLNEIGRVQVWDRVLSDGELKDLACRFPPVPKGLPVPRERVRMTDAASKVLRLGRELPPKTVVSKSETAQLAARGILAQCITGLGCGLELGPGGVLTIGSDGIEFDSNYAKGGCDEIVFAGGRLVATEPSHIVSAAPIRLVEGTTTRIELNGKMVFRTAFTGSGNLVVAGKGKVVFAKGSPDATGRITFEKGVQPFYLFGASWGPSATDAAFPQPATAYDLKKFRDEPKGRGVCAWRLTNDVVRVGWRYLSSDPTNAVFDVYCDGKKVNAKPVDQVTYFDHRFPWDGKDHAYEVRSVGRAPRARRTEESPCVPFRLSGRSQLGFLDIELDPPAPRKTPDGSDYTYFPSDCSLGDLDGDGEYELVIAWWPTRHGDNGGWWGQSGETIMEGVKLDGSNRSLWRIDLGPNLRSGPHFNAFLVADFDGDGSAELILRTGDGTVDGKGRVLNGGVFSAENRGKIHDWRSEDETVLFAPNYVTCFSGRTGEALDTVPYKPAVHDDPDVIARKDWNAVNWWWSSRMPGNQAFRFLAAVAYLDGAHPSAVMCRGYYSRTNLCAWDFDGKKLKERWFFCSETERNFGYGGQGFHNLRVGDVDFDGKDEIVYGHMCVDHDGRGLWTTGYGHGDALHLFQTSPEQRGLVAWTCHEHPPFGVSLIDCETGRTLVRKEGPKDTGSCNAMDIDPLEPGVELFSGTHCGIYSAKDYHQYMWPKPRPEINYYATLRSHILWKGDLTASAYSGGSVIWDYSCRKRYVWPIFDAGPDVDSVGGTKGNPNLIADIYGDWREELVLKRKDNRGLRVFFSPYDTSYRFHTFMEDPVYRTGVLSQNAGYNVPTSPGFYFGPDLLGHGIWFRGTWLK